MSVTLGRLVTCDRCGVTVFLKHLRSESRDGGFSPSVDKYEDLPRNWLNISYFGTLCPSCSIALKDIVAYYMGGEDKLPYVFKNYNPVSTIEKEK